MYMYRKQILIYSLCFWIKIWMSGPKNELPVLLIDIFLLILYLRFLLKHTRRIADQTGEANTQHNGDSRSEEVADETVVNHRDMGRILSVRSHVCSERDDTACSAGRGDDGVQDEPISRAAATFVCDVCNRVCRSAAGLGSHRRVHRS